MSRLELCLVSFSMLVPLVAVADEPYAPPIAERSNEGETAIRTFELPEGIVAELVAAEPDLANPVAFCIDERGRFYVAETFRQQKGVEDNRNHMHWLHDDLAALSVADRVAFFRKHLGDRVEEYTREQDRIRLLEDTDGDGAVDKATVFADGFHEIETGTGAGLLARDGNVWYTCIPDLWLLRDEDGDGRADQRTSLHSGYGVRVAFRGHDMHGLVMGPDGRLYFSIGDRGYNVETMEGERLVRPDTGAVFRCEPDGSKLEVFAYGLRNPQELAFDDHGNLFTGDNNSDSGDQARWVHVVPGGDSGWRMYFQYLDDRGPWNRETMWYPVDDVLANDGPGGVPAGTKVRDRQPAYIVPPVANLGDGPSGLVAYPGVGLSERYDGHFFLCDFRGNASNSGIRSFAVEPKGASFELVDSHQFVWRTLVTDVDFGYDGSMYATDWVAGWEGPGKGRIYRFTDESHVDEANGVAAMFREGFEKRQVDELVTLLEHPDRRVRQEAQFALASHPDDDVELALGPVALKLGPHGSVPQRHAIWALGQLMRAGKSDGELLVMASASDDAEVRAQALRTFADSIDAFELDDEGTLRRGIVRLTRSDEVFADGLVDESPRVRFEAAMGLATLGTKSSIGPLLAFLDANTDDDPYLRHAAVMGLFGIVDRSPGALAGVLDHPGPRGRMGVLLALRRLESGDVARFLNDAEPALRLEAARAINDLPIDSAMDALAELAGQPLGSEALVRRVMNANYRLGGAEHAGHVARFAANDALAEPLRLEAVEELRAWGEPSPIDRVTGRWAPLEQRDAKIAEAAVREALGSLLAGTPKLREAGVKLAAAYGIRDVAPALLALVRDRDNPPSVRAESLSALEAVGFESLADAARQALAGDDSPAVRAVARRLLVRLDPANAVSLLKDAIESGATIEQQAAVAQLGTLDDPAARDVLRDLLERLVARDLPAAIELDVIEAATARGDAELAALVAEFDRTRPADDPLGGWLETLEGGDVARGEQIFFGRAAVSCRRCHAVNGNGGIVGPDLSKIGKEKDRRYLLESLVLPNEKIAKGFETVVLATIEGKIHAGILKAEDEESIHLMTPEGQLVVVPKEDVDDRATGKSGMPEDLVKQLTKPDVRDLVAYLASLVEAKDAAGHGKE